MKISNEISVRTEQKMLRFYVIIGLSAAIVGILLFVLFNLGPSNLSLAKTSSTGAVVNAYAKVDSISGSTLYLSNVNEVGDQFSVDEEFIIIQMQEDVVRTDTNNNSSFGSITSMSNVGYYEILTISAMNRSGGDLLSLSFGSSLKNSYSTGNLASLQIVSFPSLGSGSYTTTSDIRALDWDGEIGGVLAFSVDGTLNLAHDINASGAGFRGGATNDNSTSTSNLNTVYISAVDGRYGDKGEGVHRNIRSDWQAGRGKIANGGGGGSCHNAGGGGGGNYSAGGEGGGGWNSSTSGGHGGAALSSYITSSKVYLGGGGGAGEINNNFNSEGGKGGGIIFIRASKIATSGSDVSIEADGETAPDVSNDGAGGGGAGGSILLQVDSIEASSSATLTISANGGDGGSCNTGNVHGAGAGGGQGVIYLTVPSLASYISAQTLNGVGGANTNRSGTSFAESGQGTDNSSIFTGSVVVLPVELLDFTAEAVGPINQILWSTASEQDNSHFLLERSDNGQDFEFMEEITGSGNSVSILDYDAYDANPSAITYYRLTQHDYSGSTQDLGVRVVNRELAKSEINVYPNPASGSIVTITLPERIAGESRLELRDISGKLVKNVELDANPAGKNIELIVSHIPKGIYLVSYSDGINASTKKLILR